MMPETPDPENPGYAAVVDDYWAAGWRGCLPLLRGHKGGRMGKLPSGFTGRPGVDTSYADVMEWKESRPLDNIALRLPPIVIGIDVDNYGSKHGGDTLTEAVKRWGPLPRTVRSTSRSDTDDVSGIRLYRIPAGLELKESISFPDVGLGDIEICQHHHRYIVCWPSLHPEGMTYRWLDEDRFYADIPAIDDIPELPARWVEALTAPPPADLSNGGDGILFSEGYSPKNALTGGEQSLLVAQRSREAIKELNLPGVSRHDTIRKHSLALLHLGKAGETGVRSALETVGSVFVACVAGDRDGGMAEARSEFLSMVFGRGAAYSLSKPDPMAWVSLIPTNEEIDDAANQRVIPYEEVTAAPTLGPSEQRTAAPRTLPERTHGAGAAVENQDSRQISDLEHLERGFWQQRESLNVIYTAALARMASPWSVMAFCAARALHQVHPGWRLPPVIGGPGSLNSFFAIVDRSGGGKTISKSLGRELITGDVIERNLGSGEGITTAFHKPATKKGGLPTINEAVHFDVDEVSILIGLGERSGSTTISVLKSAFSADTLGFSYVSRDVHIEAQSYRMTMVVGVQPQRAAGLIDDQGGGLPQRFMWFPANDERVSAELQSDWIPGPIVIPRIDRYPRVLAIPAEAKQLIIEERAKNARGETDAMDGHALFCREKFAYALTLLDGRTEMNSEDWELSGVAADVSTYTRALMVDELQAALENEARQKGKLLGISYAMSDEEKIIQQGDRLQRIIRWTLKKFDEKGPLTKGQLGEAASRRDRPYLEDALKNLGNSGLIRIDEEGRYSRF